LFCFSRSLVLCKCQRGSLRASASRATHSELQVRVHGRAYLGQRALGADPTRVPERDGESGHRNSSWKRRFGSASGSTAKALQRRVALQAGRRGESHSARIPVAGCRVPPSLPRALPDSATALQGARSETDACNPNAPRLFLSGWSKWTNDGAQSTLLCLCS